MKKISDQKHEEKMKSPAVSKFAVGISTLSTC